MTDFNTFKAYIIVSSRGDMRLVRRFKRLRFNEFAVSVSISVPRTFWGSLVPEALEVRLPEGLTMPEAVVGDIALP